MMYVWWRFCSEGVISPKTFYLLLVSGEVDLATLKLLAAVVSSSDTS